VWIYWARSFFAELDEAGAHVVHAVEVSGVLGDEFLEEFLNDVAEGGLFAEAALNPINHFGVGLDLPDAVAAHNNKVYVLIFDFEDVRIGRDGLLLRPHRGPLILEVTQGTGEVEATVDPAF
jgi:selenophosphate synthase